MRLATRPQSMIFLWLVGFQDRCGRGVPTIRRSPASLMGFSSKSVGANSLDGTRSRSETLGDARRERSSLLHDHRGRRGAGDDWRGPALLAVEVRLSELDVPPAPVDRSAEQVRCHAVEVRDPPADAEGNGLHPRPRPGSLSPWGHALFNSHQQLFRRPRLPPSGPGPGATPNSARTGDKCSPSPRTTAK